MQTSKAPAELSFVSLLGGVRGSLNLPVHPCLEPSHPCHSQLCPLWVLRSIQASANGKRGVKLEFSHTRSIWESWERLGLVFPCSCRAPELSGFVCAACHRQDLLGASGGTDSWSLKTQDGPNMGGSLTPRRPGSLLGRDLGC